MAGMRYGEPEAAAFQAVRELPESGLRHWREEISRQLAPRPGMRMLDLGAGTGHWARVLSRWYGIKVIAVEPSAAMRARASCPHLVGGRDSALPLRADSVDGAWVSTVIHHLPDLPAAAAELARVLRPGAPLLIRSAFPGRHQDIAIFRYFPEAIAVLDTFPAVDDVRAAFAPAGFRFTALEPVPQVSADSLATMAASLRRDGHSPLRLISDAAFEAGMARLRAAAATQSGQVIDRLDLLVLRREPG